MVDLLENVIIVTGHYGSGKTNLALNLAIDLQRAGRNPALVDLDLVNPYFRTADFGSLARRYGFAICASPYAGSNADLPVVAAGVNAMLEAGETVVFDVGGDDSGAVALGQFAPLIQKRRFSMLHVINCYRPLVAEPGAALRVLEEVQRACRLQVTHLVNNSHLMDETGAADVLASLDYAHETEKIAARPLLATAVDKKLAQELAYMDSLYPMDIYSMVPWRCGIQEVLKCQEK